MSEESVAFQLGSIKSSLETIAKTQAEDRMASAQYRTDIRKEIGISRDGINDLKNKVDLANHEIAEMKPKVISLEQRALMSAGAAKLAIVLGKAAHVISAAIGAAIVVILERWFNIK